jgi:hypothetical protein
MIEIRQIGKGDPLEFDVTVRDANSESHHQVTMQRKVCEKLGGGHTPERVLEAAFRFLLDREPKESILGRFDVSVIGQYFPEFERELPGYL